MQHAHTYTAFEAVPNGDRQSIKYAIWTDHCQQKQNIRFEPVVVACEPRLSSSACQLLSSCCLLAKNTICIVKNQVTWILLA